MVTQLLQRAGRLQSGCTGMMAHVYSMSGVQMLSAHQVTVIPYTDWVLLVSCLIQDGVEMEHAD